MIKFTGKRNQINCLAPAASHKNITIAVLPFQVQSEEQRIAQLFYGFTEDLITNFSKFVGLSVIASYSTNRIKDISDQDELKMLGADFLVFGSVRPLLHDLRISLQLVKAEDQALVFASHYDEPLDHLLETQDQMIQQIVSVLEEQINFNLLSHSYKKESVELAAYENYLLGMQVLQEGTAQSDIRSRTYFQAALEIDPRYCLAYTGLSLSYFNFWSCLLWDRWDENMKGAYKYALKAIELEPNDYTALGILGRVCVYRGEFDRAEHYLRKSLRMNASDASNLLRVSFSLMYLGYAGEAVKIYHKAIELNPFHKESYYGYGACYYLEAGDFKKSLELGRKTPVNTWTDYPAWLAAACLQLNDIEGLWTYWEHYRSLFERAVYSGEGSIEEEALSWLVTINPFRGKSYLNDLIDFVRESKHLVQIEKTHVTGKGENSFLQKGDVWEMRYKQESVILKNVKGYHDLRLLLSRPNETFHCLDLMGAVLDESDPVELIDKAAKREYLARIRELQQEMAEAESMNQTEYLAPLQEEYESLLEHLSKATGLGGKSRKSGSSLEKARSAVTWRIRSAIKKIGTNHPGLAKHLSRSIRTGTHCTYQPEEEMHWLL